MNFKLISFILLTTTLIDTVYASDFGDKDLEGEGSSRIMNNYQSTNNFNDIEQGLGDDHPRRLTHASLMRTQQNLTVNDVTPEPSNIMRCFYSYAIPLTTIGSFFWKKTKIYAVGLSTSFIAIAQLPGLSEPVTRGFTWTGLGCGVVATFAAVAEDYSTTASALYQKELLKINAARDAQTPN